MLKFLSGVNCILLHWPKKLTLGRQFFDKFFDKFCILRKKEKSYLPWLRLEVYPTSIGTKFAMDHWRPNHLRISTWLENRIFRPFLMPEIRHDPKAHGSWHIQALLFYVRATVFHGIYRYVSVWLVLMLEFQLFHFSWPKNRKKNNHKNMIY